MPWKTCLKVGHSTSNWQPTASPTRLQARARLLRDIRDFFYTRGVLEVETPLIGIAGNTDPEIQSVRTDNDRYLRTSPEFALKRLLAAGSGYVFELGRVFRAAECGRYHNPEFTLLEWYRTDCGYLQLTSEVTELIKHCGRGKFDQWPVESLTYQALFQHHLGIDPFTAGAGELSVTAQNNGINAVDLDRKQWLDLLLSHLIQPALPDQCLTWVVDFPTDQAALAKIRADSPPVAERFELYLGHIELANGYQELTDPDEQRRRFENENAQRKQKTMAGYAVDEHLLAALAHGLPDCAGVAVGVDRLLMAVCEAETLSEVLTFGSG